MNNSVKVSSADIKGQLISISYIQENAEEGECAIDLNEVELLAIEIKPNAKDSDVKAECSLVMHTQNGKACFPDYVDFTKDGKEISFHDFRYAVAEAMNLGDCLK